MLHSTAWHWIIIVVVIANILACLWLLRWSARTKVNSNDDTTGHVWDEDLQELNNPLPRWWLGMFYLSIVFALVYLVLYPGLGNYSGTLNWTQVSRLENETKIAQEEILATQEFWADYSPEDLMENSVALKTGQRLYANNCAMCHGSGGQGADGYPNLADNYWQWGEGYDNVVDIITNGRKAAMQAWGEQLGEQGVIEVVEYVRTLGGFPTDPDLSERGKAQYAKTCIACHGAEGKGLAALGAPNLTDKDWLYGSSVKALTESVANGRNGQMPAHKELLNEYKIRLLAAYVQNLSDEYAEKRKAKSN